MRIDSRNGIRQQSQYNIVVLGDAKVGKTVFVSQCIFNILKTSYKPTIEDCYSTLTRLPDGKYKTVNLVDTAGAMDFPAMKELRIRSATAIIIVYNVSNASSIVKASSLMKQVQQMRECDGVPVIVIGNLWGVEENFTKYQLPPGISSENTCQHLFIDLSSNAQCKHIFDLVIRKCHENNSWKVEVWAFGSTRNGNRDKRVFLVKEAFCLISASERKRNRKL
ncbi:hypothetical protein EB796_015396 [Bugula neritina]|uniref:Uncharacterized protein n=1 Tax=Bugula neritina TaxID=10212 RepID=A0A7J7JKY6_BUGNE|nr:hypothetical protein EB796_015396 [Bugula neritina]